MRSGGRTTSFFPVWLKFPVEGAVGGGAGCSAGSTGGEGGRRIGPGECTTGSVPVPPEVPGGGTVGGIGGRPGTGLGGRGGRTGGCGPLVKTTPVPLSATVCGLPLALSVMTTAPVLVPGPRGLKVTAIVQLALALKVAPQAWVWEKSPEAVMLDIVSEALPVLVSVTVWALLRVPTISAGKVSEEKDKLTRGAITVTVPFT